MIEQGVGGGKFLVDLLPDGKMVMKKDNFCVGFGQRLFGLLRLAEG